MSAGRPGGATEARAVVLARLAATPARLAEHTRSIPEGRPGSWGPREIARHLLTVERVVLQARLGQLAAGEHPAWTFAEPGTGPDDDRPLEVVLEAFRGERETTLARLDALDEDGWARVGDHATYGRLDVAGLCRVAADHDDEHLAG